MTTQIEIRTTSYATNKNYLNIVSAIKSKGFDVHLNTSTRFSDVDGVTLTTDAPRSVLDGVDYTKSAVTVL